MCYPPFHLVKITVWLFVTFINCFLFREIDKTFRLQVRVRIKAGERKTSMVNVEEPGTARFAEVCFIIVYSGFIFIWKILNALYAFLFCCKLITKTNWRCSVDVKKTCTNSVTVLYLMHETSSIWSFTFFWSTLDGKFHVLDKQTKLLASPYEYQYANLARSVKYWSYTFKQSISIRKQLHFMITCMN